MKKINEKTAAAALAALLGVMPAGAQPRDQSSSLTSTAQTAPDQSAQGNIGDSVVSPVAGLAVPVSSLDLSRIGAGNQSPGDPGLSIGGRYLYQATSRWSFGGEIIHENFGDREFTVPGLAGTIGGSNLTIQGLARYWLTPARTINPYLIAGLGINDFAAHVFVTANPANVLLDDDSVGLAFSGGGGIEGRFGKDNNLVAGAEMLWGLATIDSGTFGSSVVNSLGFTGRVGYRF